MRACIQIGSAEGGGGGLFNLASICGKLPLARGGAYSVGKAGVMMMSRMLALELAEHPIRCNSVSPGLVRTPASEGAYASDEVGKARRSTVPKPKGAAPQGSTTQRKEQL